MKTRIYAAPAVKGLTAGPDYYIFFYFPSRYIEHQLLNMIKIKRDINRQDLQIVHLHFVKSEEFQSLEVEDRVRFIRTDFNMNHF